MIPSGVRGEVASRSKPKCRVTAPGTAAGPGLWARPVATQYLRPGEQGESPFRVARVLVSGDSGALGGFGGTSLVAGARWAARGKDAGSARIGLKYGRDRGRRLAAIQRCPAAQLMFRQALLLGDEAEAKSGGHGLR